MPRCRACGEYYRDNPERVRARCPYCRAALYERPGPAEGLSEAEPGMANPCVAHPQNLARGTCGRCGNFACRVCKTDWHGSSWCVACVERVLETGAAARPESRAHTRQAILAFVFGVAGWALSLAGFLLLIGALQNEVNGKQEIANLAPFLIGLLLFLASPLLGILGVGQGAAAVRIRGNHMILATLGLFLSGLQTGVLLGLFTLTLWQQ